MDVEPRISTIKSVWAAGSGRFSTSGGLAAPDSGIRTYFHSGTMDSWPENALLCGNKQKMERSLRASRALHYICHVFFENLAQRSFLAADVYCFCDDGGYACPRMSNQAVVAQSATRSWWKNSPQARRTLSAYRLGYRKQAKSSSCCVGGFRQGKTVHPAPHQPPWDGILLRKRLLIMPE